MIRIVFRNYKPNYIKGEFSITFNIIPVLYHLLDLSRTIYHHSASLIIAQLVK